MIRTLTSASWLCPLGALAQAPIIEISGANFRPLPIAVPAAAGAERRRAKAAAPDFDEAFFFDCSAAGIFQVLDRKSYLADAKRGLHRLHHHLLPLGGRGRRGAGEGAALGGRDATLRGEMRVFTVSSGKEELRLVHVEPLDQPRKLAHFFADALYKQFTREPGPVPVAPGLRPPGWARARTSTSATGTASARRRSPRGASTSSRS